ncbi:hypothetical protein [Frigidibacter sp. MR17.24]|uniref:hypothetical protein n=1 Tax=Frigidibacter sp. MR17.24 TaxID=3127345 RepID=UPI003012F1C4
MNRKIFAVPMLSIALAAATLTGGAAIVAPTAAQADGCPPGLAKKHNGCRPPGHAWKDEVRREYRRDRDHHYDRRDDYRDTYRSGYREGYREAQRDSDYDRRDQRSDLDGAVRILNGILN